MVDDHKEQIRKLINREELTKQYEDKINIKREVKRAKILGKSSEYIKHRLQDKGYPCGKKHCHLCSDGTVGKALNKGKGRNKNHYFYEVQ